MDKQRLAELEDEAQRAARQTRPLIADLRNIIARPGAVRHMTWDYASPVWY